MTEVYNLLLSPQNDRYISILDPPSFHLALPRIWRNTASLKMRASFLNLLAASFILFTTATTTSHPQTPARLPFNSFPLLSRQACPTEQICGEICCPPPSICDPGAFNWCHSPLTEEVDLCEAGKEVCPDGVSCCRIGYT